MFSVIDEVTGRYDVGKWNTRGNEHRTIEFRIVLKCLQYLKKRLRIIRIKENIWNMTCREREPLWLLSNFSKLLKISKMSYVVC